jgi:hypothetical protein
MSLALVTVRARTRGKNPQTFTYEGFGKPVARKVMGKDGKPLIVDGNEIEVDDLEVSGFVTKDDLPAVLDLFENDMVKLLEAGLNQINQNKRDEASPAADSVTEDELTPYVHLMVEESLIDNVKTWRRGLTTSANLFGWTKLQSMIKTPQFKALAKTGKVKIELFDKTDLDSAYPVIVEETPTA